MHGQKNIKLFTKFNMFFFLKTENCEREEGMMCAGLSYIQVAPRLYI